MIEIAIELKKLYSEQAQVDLRKWRLETDLDARAVYLTPAEGWPGKNEEQRNTAKERVLSEDTATQDMRKETAQCQEKRFTLSAQIQGLEAERRALEFSVREQLVTVLSFQGVARYDPEARTDSAFDDAGLKRADVSTDRILEELGYPSDEPAESVQQSAFFSASDDDIPF